VFTPARPSNDRIARFRAEQGALDFAYAYVGSTRGAAPIGMQRDEHRTVLGTGDAAWARARAAVRTWRMFDFDWVELHDSGTPIETGRTVVVLVRSLGLWSLNAARIAYVVDEPRRFGFAYATLPEHAECGEELFLVTRDAETVSYAVTADSRPHQLAAKLAYPWVRRLQKRFARHSLEAMRRATSAERS
jgi:uncharacterized protein (UPF0548 family)